MYKTFKSSQNFSFDLSSEQCMKSFDNSWKSKKIRYEPKDLLEINQWLQTQDISLPIELVPEKFSNGVYLCQIINNNCKNKVKYYIKPTEPKECKFNIRKAMGSLRNLPGFKSNYMWNEDEVYQGRGQVIWMLLGDVRKYFALQSTGTVRLAVKKRASSVVKRVGSNLDEDKNQLLKDIQNKVTPWLQFLGLTKHLITSSDLTQDNVRNGVLLCNLVSVIDGPVDFCEFPHKIEEVYRNIQVAITVLNTHVPIKKLEYYYYTEPYEVWTLLHTLMLFFPDLTPKKLKTAWPYTEDQSSKLKFSLVNWINKLSIYTDDIQDFAQLVHLLKTGEFLSLLVKKTTGLEVFGIQKNPKTAKVCLMNIEKSLQVLQKDIRISQQYIREPHKIYEGDFTFIMLFLEDLHRMHAGLPTRKRGKSYHTDGPFIVKSTNKDRRPLTPQRSYSNVCQQSFDSKSNVVKNYDKGNFNRKLVENSKSALDFYKENANAHMENQENLAEFIWLKKLNLTLPLGMDLTGEFIQEFSDGVILCNILSVLEMKDIKGVKICNCNTPQARRNIKLAFEVLVKKPNLNCRALYIEDEVAKGDGNAIRLVLSEIYRIYKNTIYTLVRFNRKYRESSFI